MAAFTSRTASFRAGRLLCGIVAGGALAVVAASAQQSELVNPFGQETAAPVAVDSGDADLNALEFSGVASILDQRSFNFTDSRTRKNFWVPLNGTENGFTVESYDEHAEQVVVRRGTRTRPIPLRKTQLVAMPAAAHPAPRPNSPPMPATITTTTAAAPRPAGAGVDEIKNPKTPEEVKQAEYEARMLVSDLLDISMQERARQKALREAQARGQAAPATPPPARR